MNNRTTLWTVLLAGLLAVNGCIGQWLSRPQPDVIRDDHLAIVTATAGDTLESLAHTYLGDRQKAHWIAEFNQLRQIKAGMRVVIPLKPVHPGGLRPLGYQTVPVLFYPKIVADAEAAHALTARSFENQMQYLHANGYRTVPLDRLADFFDLQDQLPVNAVVITFDSAGRWVYEIAFPILKRYGFTAAVFIPTEHVGKPRCLTWAEVADMAAAGFDIGAGGATGRHLRRMPAEMDAEAYLKQLEETILQPRKEIAGQLKRECRYFAYSGKHTDDMMVALLKKHGYRAAFTRQRGSNPFFIDNYRVRRSTIGPQGEAMQLRANLGTFVSVDLQ